MFEGGLQIYWGGGQLGGGRVYKINQHSGVGNI